MTTAPDSLCTEPSADPVLSLVMATVGRGEEPRVFVESLGPEAARLVELILVDQNDDDRLAGAAEAARRLGIPVVWKKFGVRNLSAARNAGIAVARGRIVAFPDDDCWYEPDTLTAVLDAFARFTGVGGVVAHWVEQEAAAPTTGDELLFSNWRRFAGGRASSICLFLRRDVLDGAEWFDARLGVGGWFGSGEETDLILRVLARGKRIVRARGARVHHKFSLEPTGSLSQLCRSARRRERGTGAIYVKHRMSPWVLIRGVAAPPVLALLRIKGWRTLARAFAISWGRVEGAVAWRFAAGDRSAQSRRG